MFNVGFKMAQEKLGNNNVKHTNCNGTTTRKNRTFSGCRLAGVLVQWVLVQQSLAANHRSIKHRTTRKTENGNEKQTLSYVTHSSLLFFVFCSSLIVFRYSLFFIMCSFFMLCSSFSVLLLPDSGEVFLPNRTRNRRSPPIVRRVFGLPSPSLLFNSFSFLLLLLSG